jgi:hypothetical protein
VKFRVFRIQLESNIRNQYLSSTMFSARCKYNKKDGELQLFGNKLKFVPEGSLDPSLEFTTDVIKSQATNPVGAAKSKLQVWIILINLQLTLLIDGKPKDLKPFDFGASSFERDELKNRISIAISSRPSTPAASASGSTNLSPVEIQARKNILSRDKNLAALHKSLVLAGQPN